MKTINSFKTLFLLAIILFVTTSAKIENRTPTDDGSCGTVIRYYVSKIIAGGQEMEIKMQVTVNPTEKTLTAEMEGQDKRTTSIELKECTLNAELTSGYALYLVKDERGEEDWMKVESKEGKITISNPKPAKDSDNVNMTVDKWELVK